MQKLRTNSVCMVFGDKLDMQKTMLTNSTCKNLSDKLGSQNLYYKLGMQLFWDKLDSQKLATNSICKNYANKLDMQK